MKTQSPILYCLQETFSNMKTEIKSRKRKIYCANDKHKKVH